MKITLLGNPQSTNHLYRKSARGIYMTEQGRCLKRSYWIEVKQQYKESPIQGDVFLDIKLFFGDKRKRDIDNHCKIVLDSMNEIVYEDDSQIKKMHIEKFYDKIKPRVEVSIKKIKKHVENKKF